MLALSLLWNLILLVQFPYLDAQLSLTCQVDGVNYNCPLTACPGHQITYIYDVSSTVSSIVFVFPNETCNNSGIGAMIVVDLGLYTCHGPSGSGSCGPFNAMSISNGVTTACQAANLSVRINSTGDSSILIQMGTRSLYGDINITTKTELFFTKAPGYPIVCVHSGLTNLTVVISSSSFGDFPDYYNVVLMNGTAVVYDKKNVTFDKNNITLQLTNLLNNTLYEIRVVAINCASSSGKNLSAFNCTCKLNIIVGPTGHIIKVTLVCNQIM